MALAEACALTNDPELRPVVVKAVERILERQAKDGEGYSLAWDYTKANASRLDSSVSGYNVMALKAAKMAGVAEAGDVQGQALADRRLGGQ